MEEREIDLRLLVYKTLKCWRKALVLGLALAVLLGGYSLFKQNNADHSAAELEYQRILEEYSDSREKLAADIEELEAELTNKKDYSEQSSLMKIDAYNEYVANVHIEVEGETEEADVIKAVDKLSNFASCGEMYKYVLGKTDVVDQSRYLIELISTRVNYDAAVLDISVIGATESDAASLASIIKEAVDSEAGKLSDVHCGSKTESVYSRIDSNLANTQSSIRGGVKSIEDSIQAINEQLDGMTEPTLSIPGISLKSAVKKSVIGFVAGALVVFGWYCVKYVISSKISGDDFWKAVNVPFLGSVFTDNKRKENAIDRFIRKLCGYKEDLSYDASCVLVSANIAALQKNRSEEKLALVGDIAPETARKVLSGTGVDLAGDILTESSAVETLDNYDGVIIAVIEDVTGMDQIVHQAELLKSWGKTVVGAVSIK